MRFSKTKHTKEFLIAFPAVLNDLCRTSKAFAESDLALDMEVLTTVCLKDFGQTAAHILPMNFDIPKELLCANNFELLKVRDIFNETVAHRIAKFRANTLFDLNIQGNQELLLLKRNTGHTVAHFIASSFPQLFQEKLGPNYDLLAIESNSGCSVAEAFVVNAKHFDVQPEMIMHKKLLIKSLNGLEPRLLAELAVTHLGEKLNLDLTGMAQFMISVGAAYKHSTHFKPENGLSLLNQTNILIADALEPQIAIKHAMALYSTFSHNLVKLKGNLNHTMPEELIYSWESLLIDAQKTFEALMDKYPGLDGSAFTADYYCEPAEIFAKQYLSKKSLQMDSLTELGQEITSETNINHQLF
jgi:hypothetical protein